MTVTATPIYPQVPLLKAAAIVNGTGAYTPAAASNSVTNLVQLMAGGTNGVNLEMVSVTSTDTVANSLYLVFNDGTYSYVMGCIPVAAAAGTNSSTPAVQGLNPQYLPGLSYDSAGNPYFNVPAGTTLYVGVATAVSSGKQIAAFAGGGAF